MVQIHLEHWVHPKTLPDLGRDSWRMTALFLVLPTFLYLEQLNSSLQLRSPTLSFLHASNSYLQDKTLDLSKEQQSLWCPGCLTCWRTGSYLSTTAFFTGTTIRTRLWKWHCRPTSHSSLPESFKIPEMYQKPICWQPCLYLWAEVNSRPRNSHSTKKKLILLYCNKILGSSIF